MIRTLLGMIVTVGLICPGPAPNAAEGATLYATFCAGCHGQGVETLGPYPGLFGNTSIRNGGALYVAYKGLQGAGNMFPLCAHATDEDMARIASYVASANGSLVAPLAAQEVAGLRPPPGDCLPEPS
jgi:mono/diheme cytochrome c family protein